MSQPTLIRRQAPDPFHSVTVWRQNGQYDGVPAVTYLKVWEGPANGSGQGWLSSAAHEHLLLTVLAGRGVRSAVTALELTNDTHRVALSTLDAGPELQRDWIDMYPQLLCDTELVKLGFHALQALVQIHREGVVHADLKSDNICVSLAPPCAGAVSCLDWGSLKLIDFAFSLAHDFPPRFVFPTDTGRIDYLPDFYKRAVEQAQRSNSPDRIQGARSAAIDLFSLGAMLKKLVTRAPQACPGATALSKACLRAGSRQNAWRWPGSNSRFEARTIQLENQAQQWLRAQGLHDDAIARSVSVGTTAATAPTPLREAPQVTPLRAAAPTPLRAPAPEVVPRADTAPTAPKPETKPDPTPTPRLTVWTRLHWIGVSTLLALCFLQIDQAYRATALMLSDGGYFTALLAMVMALPLTGGALMHARRPSRGMEITCFVAATVLALVAVFHAVGIWRAGLPWLQGVQLIVSWILAVALGIRRVVPASSAA